MKRLLIFFSFTLLFFYSTAPIRAQEFDFARAISDYIYNYNLYLSSHLEYVSTKSEYLTYQTLTAQAKTIEATKKMLLARAETMRTSLTALRMKLKETTGIVNYQQNLYYLKLDSDVTWISDHKESLPSAATLEDLLKISSFFEEKHPAMEILSYQTLGQIIEGKENSLRAKVNEQIFKTESKINQIRETGEDTVILERWLIQAKEKTTRSEEKGKEAQSQLQLMRTNDQNKKDFWNKAQKTFEEENQYLKEAISFLKEIIREIKRA